ncbi:MAG: DUF2721 domain-containing protein, partial [Anaerolineales bacterium]
SGVGLLLLTMTNRPGRAIDRPRMLVGSLSTTTETSNPKIVAQLQILWMRARLIRPAITLASVSALVAAVLIIALFFTALWQIEIAWIIVTLFIACMVCLIGSIISFIHDINQSLAAFRLELVADGISIA